MKKALLQILVLTALSLTANAETDLAQGKDIRSEKDFVASCPEQFLTYIDRHEGGPGAYCQCPDENIGYIDRHEGGKGFYCSETPIN